MEYPYQIVTFLDVQPEKDQLTYGDESGGWLAQVALKRRFALTGMNENQFIQELDEFRADIEPFELKSLTAQKPERMPVEVIMVERPSAADEFHQKFLSHFDRSVTSKYPEREGAAYFPHITAEYWGKRVIEVAKYENRAFPISSVWLVKDAPDEQKTAAFKQFLLKSV